MNNKRYLSLSMQHELDSLKAGLKTDSVMKDNHLLNHYLHRIFDIQEKLRIMGVKRRKRKK